MDDLRDPKAALPDIDHPLVVTDEDCDADPRG